MSTKLDLEAISAKARQKVLDSIPMKWKLPKNFENPTTNLQRVPYECGILTLEQLELTDLTASELLERLSSGVITAAQITEAFCARAAIAHQLVNCLTDFYPEEAIQLAKNLDDHFLKTKTPVGILHGLPIAIKDTFTVKGKTTTVGLVSLFDSPPGEEDASLVHEVRAAGAIIFGRTTMPQTGMALETVSPLWGRTLNPYNVKFGSGGSSGGDGALIAMGGAPCAPLSTDIGGSIRAPAAFNGLYGMRPSSDRVPRYGLASTKLGMISIRSSVGPCCRSMNDLKSLTKMILTHENTPHEPTCIPGFWKEAPLKKKLVIGVMFTDGVVEPHPPITRALKDVVSKLKRDGHEVLEFTPSIDLWQAALTTWALYFQTGGKEALDALKTSGERPIAQFQHNFEVFKVREQTTAEVFQRHREQLQYKADFVKDWDETCRRSQTGQPVDCIICPSATMAGCPHDFPLWWGYTTIWNLLDYPSIIMPLKNFKIDAQKDAKFPYRPRDNPFDGPNWDIYDPELWKTQPMTFQIVGRHCKDEDLIAAAEMVDFTIN